MSEISKDVKIVFLLNAILALIYAFLFLVIPEIHAQNTDAVNRGGFSPVTFRQLGASMLILGVGNLIAVKRAELEQTKIFWEMGILWLILMLGIGIWATVAIPFTTAASAVDSWIGNIILVVLAILNIYYYNREVR